MQRVLFDPVCTVVHGGEALNLGGLARQVIVMSILSDSHPQLKTSTVDNN